MAKTIWHLQGGLKESEPIIIMGKQLSFVHRVCQKVSQSQDHKMSALWDYPCMSPCG